MNKNIDFSSKFKIANYLSILLFSISVLFILFKGLNYGIDFKGGTLIEMRADNKNINITFDLLNITFGSEEKGVHNSLLNFIIICGKYFIFRRKYIKTLPCFNSFKIYLNKRIEIEKHIALEKDKLEVHNRKWGQFII